VLPFAAGLAAPLAVLAYWKERGFGRVPAFATPPPDRRVASGIGGLVHHGTKYLGNNSWTQLHNNLIQLREHLWSDRVLEFLAVAGIVALFVRSRRAGVFVGSWFIAYLLLKASYINARVEDGGFWRLLLPAFPAFVIIVAAVPLLFPGVRLRPVAPPPLRLPRRALIGALAALVALLIVFPTALIAAAKPIQRPHVTAVQANGTLVPVSNSLDLRAQIEPNGVLLNWDASEPSPGKVFFHVYRASGKGAYNCHVVAEGADRCTAAVGDLVCRNVAHRAPDNCLLSDASKSLAVIRQGAYLDRPGPGTWTYRVALYANWLNDEELGDPYVFSPPVTLRIHA
jgi:hypothetical protein